MNYDYEHICPTTKNYVVFDSRSAIYLNNIFTLFLSEPITIKKKICLLSAQIPNINYNIDVTNNWIDFSISGVTHSFSITPGNYDTTTLVALLQIQMNAFGTTSFTVSFSPYDYLLMIQNSTPFALLFKSGSHSLISMWSQLGFIKNTDTSYAVTQVSPSAVDMNSPNYVYIDIDNIENAAMRTSNGSTMYCIPFTGIKGTIENFSIQSAFKQEAFFTGTQILRRLDIALYTNIVGLYGFAPYNVMGLPFTIIFEYE